MKKIISLILASAIILSVAFILPTGAVDENTHSSDVLYALGCIDGNVREILEGENEIKRGEFAQILFSVAKLVPSSEYIFRDVPSTSDYADAVNAVNSYKIMMGDGAGNFRPDEVVTEIDALVSVLRLLGYEEYARYNGGYPTGYLMAARTTKLLSGLSGAKSVPVSGKRLAILLENMLNERIYEVSGVEDGSYEKMLTEKTFLEINYNIGKTEGIVTGNTSSTLNKKQETGGIIINNMYLAVEDSSFDSYLGMNCDAYYNVEDSSLLYMEANDRNSVTVVEGNKITGIKGKKLIYEIKEGNEKEITIPAEAYILFNRRAPEFYDEAFFNIESGSVTFIDNNKDGNTDVVSVISYKTYVVDSVNPVEEIITFKYGDGILRREQLKNAEILNKSGKTDISWIHEWSVIDVMKDADGDIVTIYADGRGETKTATEINLSSDGGYITFDDGTTAPVRKENRGRLEGLKINISSIFAFDMNGYVVGYEEDQLSKICVLASVKERGNFEPALYIKYYTENGELVTKELKGRIHFNKESRRLDNVTDRAVIMNALNEAKGHMLEVDTNSRGEIISVNVMEIFYDSLGANVYVYLNNYSNTITPDDGDQYFVKKSAYAFYVPNNLTGVTADDFAIRKATAVGSRTTSIVAYRRLGSEDQEADAIKLIKYASSMDAMGAYDHPMLISKKSKIYDSDSGLVYFRLKYWHNGSETTAIVEDEKIISGIDEGDVAWLDVDDGEIMGVVKYYDYSEKSFTANRTVPTRIRNTRRLQFGKVYQTFDNFYRLFVTTVTKDAATGEVVSSVDSIEGHRYPMYGYVFDESKAEKVRKATAADFVGEMTDPENYSNILVHSSYTTDYMAVIYK